MDVTDLKRIVSGLQRGVHLLRDQWKDEGIKDTLQVFNKNITIMIQEGMMVLRNKDEMCTTVNGENEMNS